MTLTKQSTRPAREDERLPPHDEASEAGVIGCVLLDWKQCLEEAEAHLPAKEAFYSTAHAIIWDTILDLHKKKKPVDVIAVQSKLRIAQTLEHVGGQSYLDQLQDKVPSAANLMYYVETVEEKWQQRRAIAVATELAASAYEWTGEVSDLLDRAERDILAIRGNVKTDSRDIGEVVNKVQANIEDIIAHKGVKDSLTTGFPALDRKLISGVCGPKMIVIAARPSEGKTAIGMNIVEHIAIDCKIPVGVFSLEMDAEELVMRMVCSRSGINYRDLVEDRLHPNAPKVMAGCALDIRRSPIHIDDTGGLNINQLKARARRMVQRFKIKIIVVDYLQLMSGNKKGKENRQAEIADISKEMKAMAKELRIPVILMAQLNREVEKDKGRCPRLSDLRESGAIEQDADIVLMLWRKPLADEVNPDPDQEQPDEVPVKIVVSKQRGGPRDRFVSLIFQKQFVRFVNPEKPQPQPEDIPENVGSLFNH